jgi:hypothetical protein
MKMLRKFFAALVVGACAIAVAGLSGAANAEPAYRTKTVSGDFESVAFDLTNAIVNRGLKVDYTGHVSTMLDRTKDATGKGSPYVDGRYYIFCSAQLSQATMQANPDNIAACPYVAFAYELKSEPGKTVVGYRRPLAAGDDTSKAALGEIEKLLQSIIDEAAAS